MIPAEVVEVDGLERTRLGAWDFHTLPRKSELIQLPDGSRLDVLAVIHPIREDDHPAQPVVEVTRFAKPLKPPAG